MSVEADLGDVAADLVERDVCSLTRAELDDRLAMIRREIQPLVVDCRTLPDGVVFEFERDPETRARVESLAELERACCGTGLVFRVREAPDANRLCLEIEGPSADAFRTLLTGPADTTGCGC